MHNHVNSSCIPHLKLAALRLLLSKAAVGGYHNIANLVKTVDWDYAHVAIVAARANSNA